MIKLVKEEAVISKIRLKEANEIHGKEEVSVGEDLLGTMKIDLRGLDREYLKVLSGLSIPSNQKNKIRAVLDEAPSKLASQVVTNYAQLNGILAPLAEKGGPCVEVFLAGRWYPVPISRVDVTKSDYGNPGGVLVAIEVGLGPDEQLRKMAFFSQEDLEERKTLEEILMGEGIRLLREGSLEELARKAGKIKEQGLDGHGVTVDVSGPVLKKNVWLWGGSMEVQQHGSPEEPRIGVTEPELEVGDRRRYYSSSPDRGWTLPLVRVFSLQEKQYVFVDADDVSPHVFDDGAIDKLVLPGEISKILKAVFDTPTEKLFGDVHRKRGGLVILAAGNTGVGKTMTAEIFADHTRRPLYILEVGELGTDASEIESRLNLIFTRVRRWNAVLLFDEADIFMGARDGVDLKRNVIVGVFLRLLDRHEGLMFLTSNRPQDFDPAFESRIDMTLRYPDLDRGAREKIWGNLLQAAGVTVEGGEESVRLLSEFKMDGRKIRNKVKLFKLLYGDNVPVEEALRTLRVSEADGQH